VARFAAAFALLAATSLCFFSRLSGSLDTDQPRVTRWIHSLRSLLASMSGAIIELTGQHVRISGNAIAGGLPASDMELTLVIDEGCDGLQPVLLFASAVVAFPAPWFARLLGLLVGSALLQGLNLVRIASLYLFGTRWIHALNGLHVGAWQALFVAATAGLWLLWATWCVQRDGRQDETQGTS